MDPGGYALLTGKYWVVETCMAAGFVFAGFEGQSLQTQKVLYICIGQSR